VSSEFMVLFAVAAAVGWSMVHSIQWSGNPVTSIATLFALLPFLVGGLWLLWEFKVPMAIHRRKRLRTVEEIPLSLRTPGSAVYMGKERELEAHLFLPNQIRLKHVHILGATGAGKTESVVLNFLKQDIAAGSGAIILDGKGDVSFLRFLESEIPSERLKVFDLGEEGRSAWNPLADGTRSEAAQRLFSSLTWSEEYYKSKALTALQRIFRSWKGDGNPSIPVLAEILSSAESFSDAVSGVNGYEAKEAKKDYQELSGLRDQLELLCSDHLRISLNPPSGTGISLREAGSGVVMYFRIQSLLSRQLAVAIGRLLINNLSYLAGSSHRGNSLPGSAFIPTYLDEFAMFACPEFSDLIAKARSAGLALHFSHQSVGDLEGVQPGFLNQIIDNTATKIVMRINDPDTAEIFARAFGTFETGQLTKTVTNATDLDSAEVEGAGSLREVKEFRVHPDHFKSLPVGAGAVLVAHGIDAPGGATSVFKIQFPKL
jgi:conjugal transfer pilus assembly protein TraD